MFKDSWGKANARLELSAKLQAAWSKGVTRGLAILPSLKENEGLLATSYKGFPSNPAKTMNANQPNLDLIAGFMRGLIVESLGLSQTSNLSWDEPNSKYAVLH